jgi:integrase
MIAAARGEPGELEALAIRLRYEDKGPQNPATGMYDVDHYVEEMAEDLPPSEAKTLRELYDGRRGVPFDYFGKQFVESVYTNDKTKGDAYRSLKLYRPYSPTIDDACKATTRKWLASETRARKSVGKTLSFLKRYWGWLQNNSYASDERLPFHVDLPEQLTKQEQRLPFTDNDVATLLKALESDTAVQTAALLAMYTGARIAELMALKVEDVVTEDGVPCLNIRDSKTAAGIRLVPVHNKLRPILARITDETEDGYLVSGVKSAGGADRRADVIGKRFGRIKTKQGMPQAKVFHSYRKTFITKLEKASVSEGIAADIVGHEKQTITYGLYSGGTSMKQRKKAVNTVGYSLD